MLSACLASALRSSNSTGTRHSMGRHRAMMAPHRPKLSSTPRSTSASRILPRPLLALMMPDTAEAFFSPSSGVTAPMIRPKEKAPRPAGIRMPKHSSSVHEPRHSGVSARPSTAMAAPQRQWSGLAFGTDSRQPIPLITNDRNGIYQRIMERWLSRRRIVLENVIELGNTETVKSCVAGDLGIALLPRFAVERQLADGTLQAVESDFSREIITAVCSHHKNKWVTPAMELFMELTREHFAALRQPEGQQAKYA